MNNRGVIRPRETELSFFARLTDGAWIFFAMFIADQIYREPWANHNSLAVTIAIVVFYVAAETTGLYRSDRARPFRIEIARVWTCWSSVIPAVLFVAFITKTSAHHSRVVSLIWFTLAPMLLSLWRATAELGLRELRARGHNLRKAAVIGVSEVGEHIALHLKSRPWIGVQFIGFFDDRDSSRLPAFEPALGPVCGTFKQLVEKARRGEVDLVYIALPLKAEPRINAMIQRLSNTTASVYLVYDFGGFNALRPQWTTLGDTQVLSLVENPLLGVNGFIKRVEDVVIGSAILIIIAIPMLVIAVAIKLTSKGSVFFRQRRYGLNGEQIEMFKFRTMTTSDDGDRIQQALKNDPRVTKLGAFLRRTSLDELPQFFHVITGKMSIVGPRPHAVAHNEYYRELIQGYMLRHKVKPGITGWAQVNGWRGETDTLEKMKKRLEYDLGYISNWALAFDLKIILMTIFGADTRKNAY
jgi:putative colanic acid biosysnthesis UDP-glucose lipid carrier transferase